MTAQRYREILFFGIIGMFIWIPFAVLVGVVLTPLWLILFVPEMFSSLASIIFSIAGSFIMVLLSFVTLAGFTKGLLFGPVKKSQNNLDEGD